MDTKVWKSIDYINDIVSIESAVYVLNQISLNVEMQRIADIEINLDWEHKRVWVTNKVLKNIAKERNVQQIQIVAQPQWLINLRFNPFEPHDIHDFYYAGRDITPSECVKYIPLFIQFINWELPLVDGTKIRKIQQSKYTDRYLSDPYKPGPTIKKMR